MRNILNRLKLNSISSILYQILSVLIGLYIPRLILKKFGTEVNGLNYSISQMLAIVAYFDFGVGAVAQSLLYKPLLERNYGLISDIYFKIKSYFNKISIGLFFYTIFLCFYYSISKSNNFSWIYNTTFVLAISISLIGQYVYGISNQILLAADQKVYIYTFVNSLTIVINAILTYLLLQFDFSIQMVKLVTSLVFLIRPLYLHFYVKKNYYIKKELTHKEFMLPNQWSGLIQHLATSMISSLDSIVLTFLSTLSNISIYNVYTFPLNGVRILFESVCMGYKSYFGHLLANEEISLRKIQDKFTIFSYLSHGISIIFLSVAIPMLPNFIFLYTSGINDATYYQPVFSILIILSYYIMMSRIPYTTLINAAGHFKETQLHSIIELSINLVLSIFFVIRIGLIGVAIGTCAAVFCRILASIFYLKENIIYIDLRKEFKFFIVDSVTFFTFFILRKLFIVNVSNYFDWFFISTMYAVITCLFYLIWSLVLNYYPIKIIMEERKK